MQRLSIGRTPNCDIFFNDPSVSKIHAEIVVNENEVIVRDLGSTNGTFINGMRVYGSQPLKQLDILKVGNSLVPWKNYVGSNEPTQQANDNSGQVLYVNNAKIPTVGDWMLNLFLLAIPLVGFIMLIIWANQDDIVLKNYAKARLWWILIIFGLVFFIYIIAIIFYGSIFNSMRY